MKKTGTILGIILLLSFCLFGCKIYSKDPIEKTGIYFDTVIQIKIYDSDDISLLEQCFQYCDEFEKTVSRTIETSEIYRLNHAKGLPVEVSDVTLELIKKGIEYGDLTNGKFDITISPLTELWDFKNNPGILPEEIDILEALSHVNYKNIKIDENTVTLTDPDMALDLGAIAKGYMADFLKSYLTDHGVKSALINLGGNMLTIGTKPDGTNFKIGIQKPFEKQGIAITSVESRDSSVVSSGVYERYFQLDNKIYHHIIDTNSGYPYDNGLLSVTILSEKSVDGDALSTSCFALGLEDGMKLIESLDDINAVFITEDYTIYDTRINEK